VAALKLVDESNVVNFPAIGLFERAWELMPATMRKRSLGKVKLRPIWSQHAKLVGEDALLAALRAYVSDDDCKKTGGKALDRWLRDGRYEHYIASEPVPVYSLGTKLAEPFRASLVVSCGEAWVISYLDQCTVDGTVLVVPKGKATAWSRIDEKRNAMKAAGLTARRWGE